MKLDLRKTFITSLLMASSLSAFADHHWMVRTRAISIMPEVSGSPDTIGGDVRINNQSVPELDFSYFFSKNFAVELILATANHQVGVKNSSLGNVDLGSVSLLPPTLLAQYHQEWGNFKPYLGAGINYTIFYDAQSGDVNSVKYDNSMGYALQVGLDYKITEEVYLNLDVKKLYLDTTATVKAGAATVEAEVDIDPLIVGVGIGYRF